MTGARRPLLLATYLVLSPPGVEADFDRGLEAFQREAFGVAHEQWRVCARDGVARCQYALGVLLDEGHGTVADPVAGLRWYRRAADQGFPDALMKLGFVYALGRDGVGQDPMQAWAWFARAAALGVVDADRHRNRVAEFLSAEELREAQRRADELSIRYHLQK